MAGPLHAAGEYQARGGESLGAASNGAVLDARRRIDADVLPLLFARPGRQGGEVGLGKVAQHLPVECTDEQEREVAEVGEPVGVHPHGALQVEFLQEFQGRRPRPKVALAEHDAQRVGKPGVGAYFTLLGHRAQP